MLESDRYRPVMSTVRAREMIAGHWAALRGDADLTDRVAFARNAAGEEWFRLLPAVYDVPAFAAATIGTALLAVAELGAARSGRDVETVTVDVAEAVAAFRSEALQRPVGWSLPPIWDPVAGVYATADGWIRLHTNYSYHRAAALGVLGIADDGRVDRALVADAVRAFAGDDLERAVVEAGGCAAVARTRTDWKAHGHGCFAVLERPVDLGPADGAGDPGVRLAEPPSPGQPLSGVRVLDLTRVIAGPVATRTLGAWGADVLRIDPPGFVEVPAAVPDTLVGKRSAALDLRSRRAVFLELVAGADVLVHGLRPGALAGLGFGADALRAVNPGLVEVAVDAYGWAGPWAGRRGFDSLVQFSSGIALETGTSDGPGALPAQALDHGTGYLLAAAACRGLTELLAGRGPGIARGSLVGSANVLMQQRISPDELDREPVAVEPVLESRPTAWGELLAVPPPGRIGAARGAWPVDAGPVGRHEPTW
ncbi:CoA transferase [Spongisporangium articulatum]|uniref:CoA transferase n=1 Tax=Spongisporangium articulatum TaxID=3362603 RepID=A0ABW8ALP1_9ACTN